MKKIRSAVIATILSICLALIYSAPASAQISYAGAVIVTESLMPDLSKNFEDKYKVKISPIDTVLSKEAVKLIGSGKYDVIGLGHSPTNEEKKQDFYYVIAAYDALIVCVNSKNGISDLSSEQLKGIFTGKILNWKDVGGRDAKIDVVIPPVTSGISNEFKKNVLFGADYLASPSVTTLKPDLCAGEVEKSENSVSFISLPWKTPNLKVLSVNKVAPTNESILEGDYIMSRPLIFACKEVPKDNVKLFIDFVISTEGQAIVAKKFVPVKK